MKKKTLMEQILILFDEDRLLLSACEKGYKDIVEFLVSHGADVNIRNEDGQTSLHIACDYHYFDIVTYLISHGANVCAIDKYEKL